MRSSMGTEISSFLSHIAWDTILPGLSLVLHQVLGSKRSDEIPAPLQSMVHTLAVPLLLHRVTQSCSCSSCICSRGRERCEGTTDTAHTGGGAGKVQSSQGPTCKSQAQSLKDTSLDQNPLDPDLKFLSRAAEDSRKGTKYTNPTTWI